ncbi:4Fe-4S dicluster domain-containing protein [Sulfitobacter brevis]|uniref:4Fe-4S dicluster domain-containing protein n=1 Tax=Sulfitobacter brevis TaxID=74348 RepID=A0A1I2DUN9_9RHOB|nr:4Fe-4S binding protein [Sulfitobacter brevis]SFE84305.1 4Fe-4S dicluster domain-containing protein [Sulfitobacter brevis]
MTKKLMICDCLGSQTLDAVTIGSATGRVCSKVFTNLCDAQIDEASAAMAQGAVTIACQQEAPRFSALAEELGLTAPEFVDIRDRAGWSADPDAAPKMAALVAEAALPASSANFVDVISEGTCLILGASEAAFEAAATLADTLAVTHLLPTGTPPRHLPSYDTVIGKLSRATGSLGNFEVQIDALQQVNPGGREAHPLTAPRDGARSQCDVILDLRGEGPLFAADAKRDGYLRADPGSTTAVADAVLQASQMIGTFEKPLYVRFEANLCAHSRAGQPACSRCLDLCPTGAITPDGDTVSVDPMICAGCGACSAVCPSGAISFDDPPVDHLFLRLRTLATTYRDAGGKAPRLLVHDADHGSEMIRLAARFGRGLPADVIPLESTALASFGHAEMLAAGMAGFTQVTVLLSPKTEREAPLRETDLANALAGSTLVQLADLGDPDALSDLLFDTAAPATSHAPALPMGNRRQVARLATKTLNPEGTQIALPAGAPYGAVLVDTDACTLCLSCVSLCPSGALGDNPDMPQLRFQEDACLQCGLCANICPEDAITLKPQMDITDAAFTQKVLHEEEPFACVECGNLFGVKSTVEKITEKLAGKHAMFQNSTAARMIQMCDTCRINAQYHSENNPFVGKERPKPRTSEDYFTKRKDH